MPMPTSTTPMRLLLVEDSEDDAELIRLHLEQAGFEVDPHRVESSSALHHALAAQEWDIIISDYAMPTFNGMEAFRIYKAHGCDTPFIFVSGALGEERAVAAMRAGARDYLLKDNLKRLGEAVRRELNEASSRRKRRFAEEAARREARRLALAVEVSGAGIYEHRVPAGHESYFSDRWAEILGFEHGELPDASHLTAWFMQRIHADDREAVRTRYEAFIAGEQPRFEAEMRVGDRAGGWVWVALYCKAVERDQTGIVTHLVGVMLDLTQRRRLEEELRQAQKMEAMGRLAGGVAHDFNNLITVIHNFAEFVAETLDEASDAMADLREVLDATMRAASLTRQLLAFSRRQAIAPRLVDLNELINGVERMLQRLLGETIVMQTRLCGDIGMVRVDPRAFEQVLINLAVNARDAMVGGGTLTVMTARVDIVETTRATGAELQPGRYARISIMDDGCGMDAEIAGRVFEPFFTTKPQGEGTGLGLSTCYGIIQQAGGFISVESAPGHGSSFHVYLPRASEANEDRPAKVSAATGHGTETILVAEDDDQVRQLVVRILSRRGYCVLQARNAVEAISLHEEAGGRVDLLLTDVVLPMMDGKQLADRLAARNPALAVLYMSGYTSETIAGVGLPLPDTALVQKPFTPETLASRVRATLDRR